jgi:hypothetical protein
MSDFEKMAREIFPDDSRTPYASKDKAELWLEVKRESIAAALRTAYAAGAEADRWQPIETAPRDGTSILVAGGTITWHGPGTTVTLEEVSHVNWDGAGWWVGNDEDGEHISCEPTHWMPLPQKPKEDV